MGALAKGSERFRSAFDFLGYGSNLEDEEFETEKSDTNTDEVLDYSPSSSVSTQSNVTPLSKTAPAPVVKPTPMADLRRIVTICPSNYNQAKEIGEAFREGVPVIMNLSNLADTEARRMIDFAAGLIFGLQGSIEKVTNRVFLLSPKTVQVTVNQDADKHWF